MDLEQSTNLSFNLIKIKFKKRFIKGELFQNKWNNSLFYIFSKFSKIKNEKILKM
ncbi:hypothetical protein HMPREF1552_02377 [Leptotrichia sp. oral taxon 879 str. F0557]|nr:hypothetical protein HMPREF1552_02377 [Leptotrichia sp. oral taxon 879 str. F0557]